MLVGCEVIPGTIDESIAKLRELGPLVDVVKVRRHEDLRAILDAGLHYRWVVRPSSEGRNPDEVIRDALGWARALDDTEQAAGRIAPARPKRPRQPKPQPVPEVPAMTEAFTFEQLRFEWAARFDDWKDQIRLNDETSGIGILWLANRAKLGAALTPEVDMAEGKRGQLFEHGGIEYEDGVGARLVAA
jgi:hypothetical protein